MNGKFPSERVRIIGQGSLNPDGEYVLYWMTAFRQTAWNFALDRALDQALELGKPLVVLEPLRVDYPWASDRLHSFVMAGMADNFDAFGKTPVRYYPYIESVSGAGKGLLRELAANACVVVTDDYPAFFLPRALAAASRLPVRVEAVDSNGLLPIRLASRDFPTAYSFRRFLQSELPSRLEFPQAQPLCDAKIPPLAKLPDPITTKWPAARPDELRDPQSLIAGLPIDHSVCPAGRGGPVAARETLASFLSGSLKHYTDDRNHLDRNATSGLSPYLHFGHISAHEVFCRVAEIEGWSPDRLSDRHDGKRAGWWGMSPDAEAFLDQLVTWRELGFNMCATRSDYDESEALPAWALATLAEHESDPREHVYSLDQFEHAQTHDELWNAAQRQLVREGRIHNYLRMLWGKKILEWTASPRDALDVMVHLNNKYALDGRDPNSYSGIFWVLGRYDRAWGPERPVFGKVRYMSSENTRRKLRVAEYLERYTGGRQR